MTKYGHASHHWGITMDGYRLFRKVRLGKGVGRIVLYVREQWECKELCLGIGQESAESL